MKSKLTSLFIVHKGIRQNPMYPFLFLLTVAAALGLQGWRTIFNNFAVENAGVDGFWVGIIQSVREVPGFLALLVIYILWVMKEHRISSTSILVLGFGVAVTGFFPSPLGLVFTTLVMSTGFHYFETTNQSLTLQYFNQKDSAIVFGRLRSISSLANIGIGLTIWMLSHFLSYEYLFLLIGLLVSFAAVRSFSMRPVDENLPKQHKKMIFRRKYWLFYTLNFFSGARRQIFMVFAVFLLVEHFRFSIQTVTFLFILNNTINFFVNPLVASAINRFGERKVLSLEYGSLVFIFIAYAWIDRAFIVGILYVLDHIFFNCSMAIKTYFQKTADKQDIAPSMAVSFTINHITAIVLPFVGGILWMVDRRIPFFIGAAISFISLLFVQKIKLPEVT